MKKQNELKKQYYSKDVVDLYDNCLNVQEISEKLSKTKAVVVRILSQYSDKFKSDIVTYYKSGSGSVTIARNMYITAPLVRSLLRREGIIIRPSGSSNKYTVNNDYFENIDTQNKAYWLGFLYADGCVSYKSNKTKLHLNIKDIGILYALAKEIFVSDYKIYEYKTSACLEISSAKIKDDLIKHGCTPRKTFTVRIPNLKPEFMSHFFRGLFDGDGCFCIRGSGQMAISITGSSSFIIEDIKAYFMHNIFVNSGNVWMLSNNRIATLTWSSKKDVTKIIDYLYNDASTYLERKFEKAKRIKELLQ